LVEHVEKFGPSPPVPEFSLLIILLLFTSILAIEVLIKKEYNSKKVNTKQYFRQNTSFLDIFHRPKPCLLYINITYT
jgi:hypothetical protein